MKIYTENELQRALTAISSIIAKCEKANEKLAQGNSKPQLQLIKNRLKAMEIPSSLITRELQGEIRNGQ